MFLSVERHCGARAIEYLNPKISSSSSAPARGIHRCMVAKVNHKKNTNLTLTLMLKAHNNFRNIFYWVQKFSKIEMLGGEA